MDDEKTRLEEFVSAKLSDGVAKVAAAFPEKRTLDVDFKELEAFDPELADALLERPDSLLASFKDVLAGQGRPTPSGKAFAPHVRFYNLPDDADSSVQDLGAAHLGKLVRVAGVVSWVTEIKPRMLTALWECVHCGTTVKTTTEKLDLTSPPLCRCGRREFRLMEENSEFINIQRAQLQELVEKLRGAAPATHVELWMEDDLVNRLLPGEKVVVTGMLRLRPIVKQGKKRQSVYEKFLDVLHVHKMEQEFEELLITKEEEDEITSLARDPRLHEKIVRSIAPSIYGYDEIKQAIALQLFGGTPGKVLPDGETIRNDAHVLLIGDPGTAKSTLLEYVARLAPKCILVSGKGTSAAGITATAEKDQLTEGWILKAGAMVLASGGQVNIDEFDKMSDDDRSAIHQAMEQGVISIAKAGIVTTLPAKAAVLAAANPKFGRFDPALPPAQQFDIPPTLLSRFDLIFTVKDVLDEMKDKAMAEHILLGHEIAARTRGGNAAMMMGQANAILPEISTELLRKYIAYARRNVFPILAPEAGEKIKEFYLELRRLGKQQNTFPITARQIEGIIRLAEASAKLRLSQVVTVQDAERAIALVNYVLKDVFVDRETGRIDSDIINIGQPKSKLDRVRMLLGIIEDLQKNVDLVAIDDVVAACKNFGLDEIAARRLIEELKRQGDLYEPKAGHVKQSRPKQW